MKPYSTFVSLTWIQYGNALAGSIGANGSINGLTVHPRSHSLLSLSQHPVLHHNCRAKMETTVGELYCYCMCSTFMCFKWSLLWFSELKRQLAVENLKHPLYLSLGSSMSADNTGSEHNSSTSAGSTDSNICRGVWWAGEPRGWLAAPWASLGQARRCILTHFLKVC